LTLPIAPPGRYRLPGLPRLTFLARPGNLGRVNASFVPPLPRHRRARELDGPACPSRPTSPARPARP
jgi:hypothetical protein